MKIYCVETQTKLSENNNSTDVFSCLIIPAESIKDATNIASFYDILSSSTISQINGKLLTSYQLKSHKLSSYMEYGQVKELQEHNDDIFTDQLGINEFEKINDGIYRIKEI